jgi:hypothetical protein
MKIRKLNKGFQLRPYMVILGLIGIALTIGILYRVKTSDKHLISISIVALIAGAIFESKRITEKWSTVFLTALISFILSFVGFLPAKNEGIYILDSHIEIWPYWFLFFFIIFSIAFNTEKVTAKLTEGITLFQTIAVIYWLSDFGFSNINTTFLKVLLITGLFLSLYSFFHAFTHVTLSRPARLALSIWSSSIMMLFAVDYIYRVYLNGNLEEAPDLTSKINVGVEYFLLGVSSIYISQNILMITGFLPGKQTFFNAQYFSDLKELKK